MNINKILLSFSIVVIIAVSSALFTLTKMQELATNTQKLYTHPFKVSNSVSNIQTSIVTMHRNMKDVVLTQDTLEMIKIIESIQREESIVYENFDIIYINYLGSKKDIDVLYDSFKSWKIIRNEVITLVQKGNLEKAIDITQHKGKKHIDGLYIKIDVLKKYALNKADEFYMSSVKDSGVDKVVFVFIFSVIFSGIIILFIFKNLLKINQKNNEQLHLIDQNILTASITLDKTIIDISSSLCRALDLDKTSILGKKSDYLFIDESQYKKFKNIIYSAKEYKGEVNISINDKKDWYYLEIFPKLDKNYKLCSFNIFLTNISDKKKIEEVSIRDTLTGLYNRNYFEMIFEKEVRRAKRDEKSLCMIMLDIDYFKQFNDTYGHQDGDSALKSVAQVLSANTNRSYDYAFRVGGEEFVILSYQNDFNSLEIYIANILKEVESLHIVHKHNTASMYLTISAGVIEFSKNHIFNTNEMYKKVDELLYKAKRNGRNNFKSILLA